MRARVYLRIKNEKRKKNVSVTIPISFLCTAPVDESNVKNGARVVTMCNATQRNENHYDGAVWPFRPCARYHHHHHHHDGVPPLHISRRPTVRTATPHRARSSPRPRHRPATPRNCWHNVTKSVAPPPPVASGTRRLHRSVGVLKPVGQEERVGWREGGGIRHSSSGCYWSEPSPPGPPPADRHEWRTCDRAQRRHNGRCV